MHLTTAKQARVTKTHIAEAVMITTDLGAGAAVTHGTLVFRVYDEPSEA